MGAVRPTYHLYEMVGRQHVEWASSHACLRIVDAYGAVGLCCAEAEAIKLQVPNSWVPPA